MRLKDADVLIEKAYHEAQYMSKPFKEQFGVLVEWLVEKTPTIEPERKKGKWIKDDFTGIIKCDQCGNDAPMDTTGGGQYESNFCQTCGADMIGEQDGKNT